MKPVSLAAARVPARSLTFRILGPVEVERDGPEIDLGGTKVRALLALLLLHANELVSRDLLIDGLWGEQPPRAASHSLSVYVSQLRKALRARDSSCALLTRRGGYLFRVDPEQVDAYRFERLAAEGKLALAAGDAEEAAARLRSALALWHGSALADVVFEPFASLEARRLDELRLDALEARIEADLILGKQTELIGELELLVARYPLREQLIGQLMLALYRSERQAEALEVFREARSRFVDELGLEPSSRLQQLHQGILGHAAELHVPTSPTPRLSSDGGRQAPPTNLPVQPTPLIGRRRELDRIAGLLHASDVRLLTLTGPGGSGKTRLALEAAAELVDDYPDGVFLVALAAVGDPGLLLTTIAHTLGTREPRPLQDVLAPKRLLLVLDNLEHLVEAAPALSELLALAPRLKLLVTSRTPLHLSGEHEFHVPPLELPDPAHLPEPAALSRYEAVALFLERAQAVKADLAVTQGNATAIAELCVHLDGLPLAIELAAARAKLLSPQALLARLGQRFELLSDGPRDAPARQRTIRAAIDWSYDLLEPDEQTLFARLAVFAGGCTLEAAEAVCGGEALLTGLATLIDDNLLREEEQPDGEPRFTMLETIHAYALERLEASSEVEEIRDRHAAYSLTLAEHIQEQARTAPSVNWAGYERELGNFRSALAWLYAHGDAERTLRLAVGVPWWRCGWVAEAVRWRDEALRLLPAASPALQAEALAWASFVSWNAGDLPATRMYGERALALSRKLGDRFSEARSLVVLSYLAGLSGDAAGRDAQSAEAASIFGELEDQSWSWWVLHLDCLLALQEGDYTRARAGLEEELASARELGFTDHVSNALADLGVVALYERRPEDAVQLFADSLELAGRVGWHQNVAWSLVGLGCALATLGKLDTAARLLGAGEALSEPLGQPPDEYAVRAFDECSAPVRERLDEPELAAAWGAGRALGEADATAYALNTVADQVPV